MNPTREEALFALALEKPAEKRPAFLDAMCEGDAVLRQRLGALLAAHEQPDDILATEFVGRPSIKISLPEEVLDEAERVAPRAPSSGEMTPTDGAHGVTCPAKQSEEEVRASSRRLLRVKETITALRGDLDWIVMKCLEKDRSRRYETANGLAADLKRHLNNEPVVARPPSAPIGSRRRFAETRWCSRRR